MANILDYLDWRGDIPFACSPMNEVDCYILAKIGCADFTGIVPEDPAELSLTQAVEAYYQRNGAAGDYFGVLASDSIGPMLRRLPDTERFSRLMLSGFVNRVDTRKAEQFSALTITLPDGSHFVSFRGTDDYISAWKENFRMSLAEGVAAQRDAAAYLEWAVSAYPGTLIVGGHSKGGHLAAYAAAAVSPEAQERIAAVYNFDGPGFREEFLETPGFRNIAPKLTTVLPQFSIIGTLLTQVKEITVVKSNKAGISGHDGFNWEVLRTAFVRCDSLSRSSRVIDENLDEAIAKLNTEEREEFIETFFDLLTACGAETLTEINEHKLRQMLELGKGLHKEKAMQRFAVETLEKILKDYIAAIAAEKLPVLGRPLKRKKS